jgi:hypothetical protein
MAKECYDFLLSNLSLDKNTLYLEPSAGDGAFLKNLNNYVALDIKPDCENILKQDYLTYTTDYKEFVTIGNPPFGKRSKLAIDFFNKAATMSEVIAFILPVSFMKWNVQKQLNNEFKLINYFYLPFNSFLEDGKEFGVRTVFQIWVKKESKYDKNIDLRLTKAPPISHADFQIWQYNATEQALNTVEEDWKYATYRQGYHDYNEIFTKQDYKTIKEKMTGTTKQQFFFIKPLTDEAEDIILNLDFNSLAERNVSTPGFGKGDFVNYYIEIKNNKKGEK